MIRELRPDVTVLAGDVAFDGFTMMRAQALHSMPRYEKEISRLRRETLSGPAWVKRQNAIVDKLRNTSDYERALSTLVRQHVGRFYNFLKYAGKKSKVLVVRGNHDNDYSPGYEPRRIRELGCTEISGKTVKIDGFVFLGLGVDEARYLRKLKPIVQGVLEKRDRVNIVAMHYPKNRLRMLAALAPQLAVVGGAGPGEYLVSRIRTILSDSDGYLIELSRRMTPKVSRVGLSRRSRMARKWFWHIHEEALIKSSNWLRPYPERVGFLKIHGHPYDAPPT